MEEKFQVQSNWLLFFLFLLFIHRSGTQKINLQQIDLVDLDKKSKLLNRIKGYMEPGEQHIVHSAEIVLQIIGGVKSLVDHLGDATSEITYSSLSLEDKKRNMLMDVSEFFEDEKKILIHQAVDFDIKVKTLEKKLGELRILAQKGDHIAHINDYIEVFEPILSEEAKEKVIEFKRLINILRVINNLRNKETIEEMDIIDVVEPFVKEEQREYLMRMVQIFKIINALNSDEDNTPSKEEVVESIVNLKEDNEDNVIIDKNV